MRIYRYKTQYARSYHTPAMHEDSTTPTPGTRLTNLFYNLLQKLFNFLVRICFFHRSFSFFCFQDLLQGPSLIPPSIFPPVQSRIWCRMFFTIAVFGHITLSSQGLGRHRRWGTHLIGIVGFVVVFGLVLAAELNEVRS